MRNSPHSTVICKIQKRIIRIMTKSRSRDSCRRFFQRLEILPLHSQYIFSVLLFVVKNKDLYTTNQEIRNINTRSNINLHPPVCNLTIFQKGAYFSDIKLFNHLPQKQKVSQTRQNYLNLRWKGFLTYTHFIQWRIILNTVITKNHGTEWGSTELYLQLTFKIA